MKTVCCIKIYEVKCIYIPRPDEECSLMSSPLRDIILSQVPLRSNLLKLLVKFPVSWTGDEFRGLVPWIGGELIVSKFLVGTETINATI